MNQIASRGVTPKNNAAVLLWEAWGPKSIPEDQREKFFQMLGMELLPEKGKYFVDLQSICDQHKPIKGKDNDNPQNTKFYYSLMSQLDQASRKPWSKEEFPLIAQWLDENQEPLRKVVTAGKRDHYFSPRISQSKDATDWSVSLDETEFIRSLARLLLIRSNRYLQERKMEEARQDLFAYRKLLRVIGRFPESMTHMLSMGSEREAFHGINALAVKGDLSSEAIKRYQADIASLKPMKFDAINVSDRLFLDSIIITIVKQKLNQLQFMPYSKEQEPAIEKLAADSRIDWDVVLRHLQPQFDRMNTASHLVTYAERLEAMKKIAEEARSQAKESIESEKLQKILGPNTSSQEISLTLAKILWEPFASPSVMYIQIPAYYEAHFHLHRLVLALAAYHNDKHSYPKKLADLSPKYIDSIPLDPFSDQDYKYSQLPDGGYLLYSIGRNRKDDGGKKLELDIWSDDKAPSEEERSWDDIAIRTPS
jgi:hypothetical protein